MKRKRKVMPNTKEEHLHIRVAKGVVWNYINKILEFGIAACFSIIVGRTLGPKIYGSYNLIMSFTATLILFFSFGFESIMNKFIPQLNRKGFYKNILKLYKDLFVKRLIILLFLALVVFIASSFFSDYFSEKVFLELRILIVCVLLAIGLKDMMVAFFTSLLRIREITIIRTISQILGLGIVITLFLLVSPSLEAVLWSFLLSIMCLLFIGWVIFKKSFGNSNESFNEIKRQPSDKIISQEMIKFGFYIWLINISTFLINGQINLLLLGALLKDTLQVGYYSTALLFGYLPGVFISALAGIFLPILSEVNIKQGKEGLSKIINGLAKMLILTLIPIIFFLGWFTKPIILAALGEKFIPSVPLIQVYTIFAALGVLGLTHLTTNTLYTVGLERIVLVVRVICGILNIGLVFILVPPFGAVGAVLSLCISVIITQSTEFIIVCRNVRSFYPLIFSLKVLAGAACSLFILNWFRIGGIISLSIVFIFYQFLILLFYKISFLFSKSDKKFLTDLHPFSAFIVKWL